MRRMTNLTENEMPETKIDTSVAEANALQDYQDLLNKVILVTTVDGFVDADNGTTFVDLDPPAVMRVRPYGTDHALQSYVTDRWMEKDRLDPTYDVELIEPHPQLEGMRSFWLYGQTYTDKGEKVEGIDFQVAPDDLQARHAPKVDTSSPWHRP
jgi:hypothetical protein